MTESAQGLTDLTAVLGVLIAFVGALLANPEATEHAVRTFWDRLVARGQRVKGFLTRFLPDRRKRHVFGSINAQLPGLTGTGTLTATGEVGWSPTASTEAKLEFLLGQTRALSRALTAVRRELGEAERRAADNLREATDSLNMAIRGVSEAVEELRQEVVRSGASALPIIATGVVMTGLAPYAKDLQRWVWVAGLVLGLYIAGRKSVEITRAWLTRRARAKTASAAG